MVKPTHVPAVYFHGVAIPREASRVITPDCKMRHVNKETVPHESMLPRWANPFKLGDDNDPTSKGATIALMERNNDGSIILSDNPKGMWRGTAYDMVKQLGLIECTEDNAGFKSTGLFTDTDTDTPEKRDFYRSDPHTKVFGSKNYRLGIGRFPPLKTCEKIWNTGRRPVMKKNDDGKWVPEVDGDGNPKMKGYYNRFDDPRTTYLDGVSGDPDATEDVQLPDEDGTFGTYREKLKKQMKLVGSLQRPVPITEAISVGTPLDCSIKLKAKHQNSAPNDVDVGLIFHILEYFSADPRIGSFRTKDSGLMDLVFEYTNGDVNCVVYISENVFRIGQFTNGFTMTRLKNPRSGFVDNVDDFFIDDDESMAHVKTVMDAYETYVTDNKEMIQEVLRATAKIKDK